MRVIICEDNGADREKLLAFCARYTAESGHVLETQSVADAGVLPSMPGAELLFLDIYMDGAAKGVAAARAMREAGWRGAVVFTTASREHYPEGFEVGAVHYLLKPFAYAGFLGAMERAFQVLGRPSRAYTLPVPRGKISLPEKQIFYAEVHGHKTLVHLGCETVEALLPLKELEAILSAGPFLRCCRSHIVNMDHISRMEDEHILLVNGERLPLTFRNRRALRKKYMDYRFGGIRGER